MKWPRVMPSYMYVPTNVSFESVQAPRTIEREPIAKARIDGSTIKLTGKRNARHSSYTAARRHAVRKAVRRVMRGKSSG